MDAVDQCLRQLRRRWWWQRWARTLVSVTIWVGAAELVAGFLRIAQGYPPFTLPAVVAGIMLAPLAAGLINSRRDWSLPAVARLADELTRSRDRFSSYVEFAQSANPSALEKLTLADVREFAAKRRLRPPAENWWCLLRLLPILLFALMFQLAYFYGYRQSQPERQAAAQLLEKAAPPVAELARKWADRKLEKAAEQLTAEAAALRERARNDPRREALEALAKSEQAIRESAGNLEELQAAAQALAEAAGSTDLREAVQQKDDARAAAAARAMSAEQMAEAIARAAEAGGLPRLEALRDAPNPGEAAARMMEQTARSRERNREMEKLLASLRDLKNQASDGQSQPDQSAEAQGEDAATASMNGDSGKESEAMTAGAATEMTGDGANEGGGDGGDLTPAQSDETSAPPNRKEALANLLGEGKSLQDLVLSGADSSEARRQYQQIYQAAQSDEASAVERESIPARSRETVKRYLESIRP